MGSLDFLTLIRMLFLMNMFTDSQIINAAADNSDEIARLIKDIRALLVSSIVRK